MNKQITLLVCSFFIFSGCATIPKETILLNQEITNRLEDLQKKHLALLELYFKEKLEHFDEWYITTYEPAYLENYKKTWSEDNPGEAFDLNNSKHRSQYIQDQIVEYLELSQRIKDLHIQISEELKKFYKQMLKGNEAVTNLLISKHKHEEALKNLYQKTVGTVVPSLNLNEIDKKLESIESKAMDVFAP